MKNTEIISELILENFPSMYHFDGKGNITITAVDLLKARGIDLALDAIGAKYKSYPAESDSENHKTEFRWEFKIESIQDECPILYNQWKILDDLNAKQLVFMQQLASDKDLIDK
jgi:hypothetical protein